MATGTFVVISSTLGSISNGLSPLIIVIGMGLLLLAPLVITLAEQTMESLQKKCRIRRERRQKSIWVLIVLTQSFFSSKWVLIECGILPKRPIIPPTLLSRSLSQSSHQPKPPQLILQQAFNNLQNHCPGLKIFQPFFTQNPHRIHPLKISMTKICATTWIKTKTPKPVSILQNTQLKLGFRTSALCLVLLVEARYGLELLKRMAPFGH